MYILWFVFHNSVLFSLSGMCICWVRTHGSSTGRLSLNVGLDPHWRWNAASWRASQRTWPKVSVRLKRHLTNFIATILKRVFIFKHLFQDTFSVYTKKIVIIKCLSFSKYFINWTAKEVPGRSWLNNSSISLCHIFSVISNNLAACHSKRTKNHKVNKQSR